MKKTLDHITPHSAGKVVAIIYVPLAVIIAIVALVAAGGSSGWLIGIGALIGYPLLAYVATAIVCLLYNVVSGRFGGIEGTFYDVESETPA